MADKIYLQKCSAKASKFGVKLSFNADALIEQIKQHTNSKGYFNFEILQRKEIGKFGDTHSLVVDTWEPTQQSQSAPVNLPDPDSELPF